ANSTPKNRLLFGNERAEETAVLTEGVIDAMSFDVAGISGISVGGARVSDFQAELIKRSGIKTLYLGGDNDEQGRALNEDRKSTRLNSSHVSISYAVFCLKKK